MKDLKILFCTLTIMLTCIMVIGCVGPDKIAFCLSWSSCCYDRDDLIIETVKLVSNVIRML